MTNRHQLDFEIYQCLDYGDETRLAKARGKSPSYYAQMLSPDDERESNFVKAADDFGEWYDFNPSGAKKALAIFLTYVEARFDEGQPLDIATEVIEAVKETSEVAAALMQKESYYTQLRETVEAIGQLERTKKAILKAINDEKSSFNGSTTRHTSKAFVEAHKNGGSK